MFDIEIEQEQIEINQEQNDEPICGDRPVKVYIKVNNKNEVVNISSEVFITDHKGWILIDEGVGNDYAFAEIRYLSKPIISENGVYNFVYKDGRIVKKDEEVISLSEERTNRINELKRFLSETDYKAIKFAEGIYAEEEYAPIREQRQEWREEINMLEAKL